MLAENVPYEHVSYIESHHYVVDFEVWTTFPYEMKLYIILDTEQNKYNLYVLDYWAEGTIPTDVEVIVQLHQPQPLEIARQMFPKYKFCKRNYGF